MRRLPVYLLLDVSGSMRGEPIKAVQNGLQILISTLRQNPYALETAYLSVITFGQTAQQIIPLTELIQFQTPTLNAEGIGTSMGTALNLLTSKIKTEIKKSTADTKGDWKPIVFLMTDGEPTDDWEIAVNEFKKVAAGIVIACAAGHDANTYVLKLITENVVELETLDTATATSFFQWISSTISTCSQKVDSGKEVGGLDELPPLPNDVKKVIDLRKGGQSNNPYNVFDKQRALNKDKFGNLDGTEFDLAKDGAFNGYQIAVLHLYTGEGFNFSLPEQALKEKGFSIHRWQNNPPSVNELKKVLDKSCQLWVISDTTVKLKKEHITVIKDFFNSGKGLYLWGDNEPFFADANAISEQLFHIKMSGNEYGDKVVQKKSALGNGGFVDHQITTGLDFLYEGITIATFPAHKDFNTLVHGSCGKPVTVVYDKNNRRVILDGGYTRLYCNWDTAGTARYVKNAAAWLVNYEFFHFKK